MRRHLSRAAAILAALLAVTATASAEGDPNRSPDCSAVHASSTLLAPPADGGFRRVEVLGATDPDPGDELSVWVTSVRQDERVIGRGDRTAPDAMSSPTSGWTYLRHERSRYGDGRVYFLSYYATDHRGGSCSGQLRVGVPKRAGLTPLASKLRRSSLFDPFGGKRPYAVMPRVSG
ncbi:MAG: hypothetical protein QOD83_4988 [Solirubrobacteraceae bacterium]|nr:hypothetical protein [Solirubrobacteraceae bacterium]